MKHHFQNNLGENGIAEDKLIKKREFTEVRPTETVAGVGSDTDSDRIDWNQIPVRNPSAVVCTLYVM